MRERESVHMFGFLQNKNIFNFSGHTTGIGNVLYLIYCAEHYYCKISSQCLSMLDQQKPTTYEEILKWGIFKCFPLGMISVNMYVELVIQKEGGKLLFHS